MMAFSDSLLACGGRPVAQSEFRWTAQTLLYRSARHRRSHQINRRPEERGLRQPAVMLPGHLVILTIGAAHMRKGRMYAPPATQKSCRGYSLIGATPGVGAQPTENPQTAITAVCATRYPPRTRLIVDMAAPVIRPKERKQEHSEGRRIGLQDSTYLHGECSHSGSLRGYTKAICPQSLE
jgi:hypothetical protein